MEVTYGVAERVWVFDRGITSEENLEFLRSRGAKYVVGTPKSQLKRHEASLLDDTNWESARGEAGSGFLSGLFFVGARSEPLKSARCLRLR